LISDLSFAVGHVIFPLAFVHFAVSTGDATHSRALTCHPEALIDAPIRVVFDSLAVSLVGLVHLTPISVLHPGVA
jgi:hypothetical protein